MKRKLKSILAIALCAVGFAAMPSAAEAQEVTASEAYFFPAKADIAPKDANRSHYRAYIIEAADDGDAVLAHAKETGMSGIDSEKKAEVVNDKLGWQFEIDEYGVTTSDAGRFSPMSFDLSDNAYLVVFYHTDGVASEVCVLGAEPENLDWNELYFDADPFCSEGYNSGWQAMPPPTPPVTVEAVSAEGFLDLTVGDRIAAAEEPIVVDPKWGEAKKATVEIDGENDSRQYNTLTIDTWDTTALTLGRYEMTLTAGTANETAVFWKTDSSWDILDGSIPLDGIEFQSDRTYLVLGTNSLSNAAVLDGAKFEYGAGAGFKGGTVAGLPKRYAQNTLEGDFFQIVEKIKGSGDNPWEIGEGVTAYTNGTELVIEGKGTVVDLSVIPDELKGGVLLTLPDGWQGELPDEAGNWYDATEVTLTRWPMAVKNVKPAQRYPWNGLVDITYGLTGTGLVEVVVSVTTNGVKAVANPTVSGEAAFDLEEGKELKGLKLIWDAKTDFGDEGLHEKVKVKLTVEKAEID